ncbi:MAG: hypothetical protein E7649_07465 [Ruminococcaceae bacterium]|nr:hypothetical protein [Oscillospiraceae bacterium]
MKFMRLPIVALLLPLIVITLCSCGNKKLVTCREVIASLTESEVGLPAGKVYDMRADEGNDEHLAASLLCALYGNGGKPTAADSWVDCAIFLSATEHPCEFAVFLCDSRDSAIDTARALSMRLDTVRLTKKAPQYCQMLESARVTIIKNYVVLIISSDAENALKTAKKQIG